MNKKMYKYRDKVNGRWIPEPVSEDKILELVTRGTLTPYDFVQICEDGEDDTKKEMIRNVWSKEKAQEAKQKGEARREIAEERWAMLRKIRVDLKKLWEAQLDEIMAIISSGLHKGIDRRFAEPSLEEFRNVFKPANFQQKLKDIWHSGEISNFVQNELYYRQNAPKEPTVIDISSPNDNESDLAAKKQKLREALQQKGWNSGKKLGDEGGVYAFFASDKEAIRVGKTDKFSNRLVNDYATKKDIHLKVFSEACRVELYNVNGGIGSDPLDEFESLLIFCLGSPCRSFRPIHNKQLPSASQVDEALTILGIEICQLKSTGQV